MASSKWLRIDWNKVFFDFPAKLLSIALAFGLFFFNRLENIVPKTLLVPLSLSFPERLTPSENFPRRVRVLVRGPRDLVEQIGDTDYEAIGSVTEDRGEGIYMVPLRLVSTGSKAPLQGIEVNLEIDELRLELQQSVTKLLDVRVPIVGNPENGFQLESIITSPPAITVRGPRSKLEPLALIYTEKLEVSTRTESFSARLQLNTPDPLIELTSGTLIEVRVQIVPIIDEKSIEELPVLYTNLSPSLKIVSEPVLAMIRISGPQTLINLTGAQNLSPTVNLENITLPGTYELPIRWNLDPRIQVLEQFPLTVKVELEGR